MATKASEKSNVIDIVNGISQAAANGYDGALDENGEPISIGLDREEGNPITDSRVIDGFGYTISGNRLRISYHSECNIKEVHNHNKFEGEIESKINKIKNL